MTLSCQIQCVECSHRPPRFDTDKDVKEGDGWPGAECALCGGGEHFIIAVSSDG